MAQVINEQQVLLPGYEILLHVRNDNCTSSDASSIYLREVMDEPDKYISLGGTACSTASKSTAILSPIIRMPQISWASVAADLSDRSTYPTFFRTRVQEASANTVWCDIAKMFGWKRLLVARGEDDRFGFQTKLFAVLAAKEGIDVSAVWSILTPADAAQVAAQVLKTRSRVLVMITYEYSITYFLCESLSIGVNNLLLLTTTHTDNFWQLDYDGRHDVCTAEAMDQVAQYMVWVGASAFRTDVKELTCAPGMTSADYEAWWEEFKVENEGTDLLPVTHSAAANAADGVCMLALAVRSLLQHNVSLAAMRARTQGAFDAFNHAFAESDFEGVSGRVRFPPEGSGDGAGDPMGSLDVFQVLDNVTRDLVFTFEVPKGPLRPVRGRSFSWPNGDKVPSDSFPECGTGKEPFLTTCKECAPGQFKTATAGDDDVGDAEDKTCSPCFPGTYSSIFGASVCTTCPYGEYAKDMGMSACVECRYGHIANDERTGCEIGVLYFVCASAEFVLTFFSIATLVLRIGRKVKIVDMSLVDGKLHATTLGAHLLWHRWRGRSSTRIRVSLTGHPSLDAQRKFRARVVAPNRIELLSATDESPISEEWVTSRGVISQPFPLELLDTHSFGRTLPSFMTVIGLFLAGSLVAMLGHVDEATSCISKLAGAAVATVIAATARHRMRSYRTPIQSRLAHFRQEVRATMPHPVATRRGPGRAINAQQLEALFETFRDFIKGRDMHYVCANIVLPLTQADRLAYADFVGPSTVTWFVSHCWATPFREFAETLRKHAQILHQDVRESRYWICTFSNNQWEVEMELGTHIQDSSFHLALMSNTCLGTVMVIDAEALPLQRVWCLFEVATTYERAAAAQSLNETSNFEGLVLCTQTGVLNKGTADMDMAIQIAQRLLQIDLRLAESTNEEDKEAILHWVEGMPGGFKEINGFVRTAIRNSLIDMHDAFEHDFEQLVNMLKSSKSTLSRMLSEDMYTDASERSRLQSNPSEPIVEEGSATRSTLLRAMARSRASLKSLFNGESPSGSSTSSAN